MALILRQTVADGMFRNRSRLVRYWTGNRIRSPGHRLITMTLRHGLHAGALVRGACSHTAVLRIRVGS